MYYHLVKIRFADSPHMYKTQIQKKRMNCALDNGELAIYSFGRQDLQNCAWSLGGTKSAESLFLYLSIFLSPARPSLTAYTTLKALAE